MGGVVAPRLGVGNTKQAASKMLLHTENHFANNVI
jgi:hypothetical protein